MITTLPLRRTASHPLGVVAEWSALVLFVAVAVTSRLANLGAFAGKFDEGIRGAQLMLMAAGYRPFRDIFASQGPLSLDVFYPTFVLFGQTLEAARMAPALLSIVGLLATAFAARGVAGPVAGAVAGATLLLSPTFLKNSRLALVEVPALAPTILAVGAALAFSRDGNRRWLVGAGALTGLALATKPMVAPALIPIGLIVLLRGRGWIGSGLVFAGSLCAVLALAVLWAGPVEVYDQMVRFRVASRRFEGWSLRQNWAAMSGEWVDEGMAVFAAAVGASLLLLATRPRVGVPLVAWVAASFGLLMAYSPLQFKHAVIVLPSLALLVGVGAGTCWQRWSAGRLMGGNARRIGWGIGGIGLLLAVGYVASLPRILDLDRRLLSGVPEARPESFDGEIALIPRLTGPDQFILVDEPSVAFEVRRLVPPSLVDTSMVRIRSRSIDADDAIRATERFDVKLLFLYSDGLRSVRGLSEWFDRQFVAVTIAERRNGKDRAIYLRRDADLATARGILDQSLQRPSGATFGRQLRLLGHGVDRAEVRPGSPLELRVGWEAVAPVAADYAQVTVLRDRSGQIVEQNQRSLGGGGEGTGSWQPGRWTFRTSTLAVPANAPPGDYGVFVGLYDSKARRMLPVDNGAEADAVPLTTIAVRP